MSKIWLTVIAVAALSVPGPVHSSEKGWDDAGSIATDALVVAAFAVPAAQGDWDGVLLAGGSIAAATVVTRGLKEIFPEWRPDDSDRKSFPSGHASMSFAAAATLHKRYGWEVGLPAQIVAAFVGYSRVEAKKHHVHDVLAGAVIGELSGFLITRRANDRVQIFPWGDTRGGGVLVSMQF